MPRSLPLSDRCLACSVPLAGPLAVVARCLGIQRSPFQPNLCSRCQAHLTAGQIGQVSILQIRLNRVFRLRQRAIPRTQPEVDALLARLRCEAEALGAFVPPHRIADADGLEFRGFFNLPVAVNHPAQHAFDVAQALMRVVRDEQRTLGLQLPAAAAVVSGYGELLETDDPCGCYPYCSRLEVLPALLDRAPDQSILLDAPTQALVDLPEHSQSDGEVSIVMADGSDRISSARDLRLTTAQVVPLLTQVLGLLAAAMAIPCVAMVLVSPLALALGMGSIIAAALPFYKAIGMGFWPRVLLSVTALLVSTINLISVERRLASLRRLQQQSGLRLRLPRQQRRRLRLVRWSAVAVLALVVLEGVLRVWVMKMPLL
jgi:hypothetical protein